MSPVLSLIAFGLRQAIGEWTGDVVQFVAHRLTDHSQKLSKALAHANDRAWQTVEMALAGDRFLDHVKKWIAPAEERALAEQVRLFLQSSPFRFKDSRDSFRKQCLGELRIARQSGVLSAHDLSSREIIAQTANFKRYADSKGMIEGAGEIVNRIARDLAEFPNLSKLLREPTPDGPPLVVVAFAYFFRREVETDHELAHGLFFDTLRQLSASQAAPFAKVGKALTTLGDKFDQVFDQLDRIEKVVVETQGTVLDLRAELRRLGNLSDELRCLMEEVLHRVSQAGMHKGEVKPQHSFSIRSEDERTVVKQLLARFRQLPVQQQHQVPALHNGLGKLQFGSADFDGARQTFVAVAEEVQDPAAQAEVQYNIYRSALEERNWDAALAAAEQAADLDSQFAFFPRHRYKARRILGAGGFGTAFLCYDDHFEQEVVVKTLHTEDMDRSVKNVFKEAAVLKQLSDPAIIRVEHCDYADPVRKKRPYIVMEYFPGHTLQTFVERQGTLPPKRYLSAARQIVAGMVAAHRQGVLHRDLKPENILVREEGEGLVVKIIDFGLALRWQVVETSAGKAASEPTLLGDSVGGTLLYSAPEQLGRLRNTKPGPYSDVYAFGKLSFFALFQTTELKRYHWARISPDLADLLEQCTAEDPTNRFPDFEAVLKLLETLDPKYVQRIKGGETRQQCSNDIRKGGKQEDGEKQRQDQKQTEKDRKREEREASEEEFRKTYEEYILRGRDPDEAYIEHFAVSHGLSKERANTIKEASDEAGLQEQGEAKLTELVRDALGKTQGKPTKDDTAAANAICRQHRIDKKRAKQIVEKVREQWQNASRLQSGRNSREIRREKRREKGTQLIDSVDRVRRVAALKTEDWQRLQYLAEMLEDAWEHTANVNLGQLLPPADDPLRPHVLREFVITELEIRWRKGIGWTLEQYFEAFPELGPADAPPAELLYEEYRIRQRYGDRPQLASYQDRFPKAFEDLQRIIAANPVPALEPIRITSGGL